MMMMMINIQVVVIFMYNVSKIQNNFFFLIKFTDFQEKDTLHDDDLGTDQHQCN